MSTGRVVFSECDIIFAHTVGAWKKNIGKNYFKPNHLFYRYTFISLPCTNCTKTRSSKPDAFDSLLSRSFLQFIRYTLTCKGRLEKKKPTQISARNWNIELRCSQQRDTKKVMMSDLALKGRHTNEARGVPFANLSLPPSYFPLQALTVDVAMARRDTTW